MKGKWDSSDEEDESSKTRIVSKKQRKMTTQSEASNENIAESMSIAHTEHLVDSVVVSSVEAKVSVTSSEAVNALVPPVAEYNSLFQGCRSVDCYQRLNYIDEGTYGMVFRAKDIKTNEVYALKQVKLGPETTKVGFPITALREINILLALQHPNIVKVKEMVVGSAIDKIYMVMEFCENDLKMCMQTSKQSFSIAEIKRLMKQLLSAIEHMHSLWYIHRDLKSSNLLYSNRGVLCVCDFGLARKYGHPIAAYTHEVVTLWYRAPELLLGSRLYSTPIDMWSVGCIMAEMVTGEPLFPGQGEIDQMNKIFTALGIPNENLWPGFASLPNCNKLGRRLPTRGNLAKSFPATSVTGLILNDSGFDLLTQMLLMDPARRMTAKDALNHRWFDEAPYPTAEEDMPKFKSKHE